MCCALALACSRDVEQPRPLDQAVLDRAERLMQVGRVEDAAPLAARLVESHPEDWRVHDLQARIHLRRSISERTLGRMDQWARHISAAVDAYAVGLEAGPDSAGLHRSAAEVAQSAGRVQEARDWYRTAIALDPQHPRPLFCLAQMDMESDPQGAVSLLEQVIALEPSFAEAHASLAVLSAQAGRADEAEAHVARAIAIAPDAPSIRLAQARMYRMLGAHTDAVAILTALDPVSQASEPHTWEAARNWAALDRFDRVADAWTACLAAHAHRSDAWRFAIEAARARVRVGDLPAAAVLLDQAQVLGAPSEVLEGERADIGQPN